MGRGLKFVRFLFVIFLLTAIILFSFVYAAIMPQTGLDAVVFTVSPGQTAKEIAGELEKQRIIRSALVFELLVKLSQGGQRIKAGDYEITPGVNSLEVLRMFIKGDVKKVVITIPEGSRAGEIAEILAEKGIHSSREFLDLARSNRMIKIGALYPKNLEGFLYPDTYHVAHGIGGSDLIKMMTERFEEVVIPVYNASLLSDRSDFLSVVTLASLVENEARLDDERPLIASVYHNRLRVGMPLQCDATIQYILKKVKPVLTYDDLKLESPYNTYLHTGLPPGPICNPGIESIKAALEPAKGSYLYYVLNEKKGDGSHVFSMSNEEHERARREYQIEK